MTDSKRSKAAKKAAQTRRQNEQAKQDQADAASDAATSDAERDENGETQVDRDAARDARADKVLGSQEPESDVHQPFHKELAHAGFDHHGAEEQRQAELAAQREEHNRRTGDASLR